MFEIPAFALAAVIFLKEYLLWRYHKTLPLWLRAASVLPGFLLGLGYVVFGVYEVMHMDVDLQVRASVDRIMLFAFFFWNGVILYITRDQHRGDIQ